MTDRFTYDKPVVAFSKGGINDNVNGETYEFTMDTVLDLLNELQMKYDAQKELYAHLDCVKNRLYDENNQLQKDCTALIYHNQEYRKENEQLKEEIKDLNDVLARYEEKELVE